MSIIKICILVTLFFTPILAQDDSLDNYHHFNINFGADLARGLNAGFMVIPFQNIFIGFNYGRDVANFISLSDPNERFSYSLYYHGRKRSRAFMSISYTKVNFLDKDNITKQNIYSLNFGSFSIYENNFVFYYHFGILLRHEENNSGSKNIVFPNIGFGTNLNLF